MTEAEIAIEEKLRRKKEEELALWEEYKEQRDGQRKKEEEDLRRLKERQARRRAQRAEQERLMQEMRRKQEENRQKELEERRNKEADAKRMRLEEAEKKRLAMQEAIKRRDEAARRQFVVPRTSDKAQTGPMIVGMRDVMKTKEQLIEDKKVAMKYRLKQLNVHEGMRTAELKKAVNELWALIVQLESDKYDLEEEQKRQEYHLKELFERQKQMNKNKAIKLGLEIEDFNANIPPKVRLTSKYERKVDRRTFNDKTSLFDGGYVEQQEEIKEKSHEEKLTQFKETHGDKHVPKWDPSALRKETYEPGKIIYEESEDEEDDDLVNQLREYVGEKVPAAQPTSLDRRSSAQSNQTNRQPLSQQQSFDRDTLTNRRRSSQLSQASVASSKVSTQQQQQQQQQTKAPNKPQASEDEEEYEDEEYEEEEYTTEEE